MRLLLLTLVAMGTVAGIETTCLAARNQCVSRIGCSMALNNFQIACGQVKLGMVDHCTDDCMRAVVSLVTVADDIGTDYLTCNCDGNEDCMLWKNRISMCSNDVLLALKSLDNEEVISCSLARMLCEADTGCYTALSYYEDRCKNLWARHAPDGMKCTAKCNNSLNILYRQKRATKLKNCRCDNTDPIVDEGTCIRMRYNTETYCLNKEPAEPFIDTKSGDKGGNYDSTMKVVIGNTAMVKSSATEQTMLSINLLLTIFLVLLNIT